MPVRDACCWAAALAVGVCLTACRFAPAGTAGARAPGAGGQVAKRSAQEPSSKASERRVEAHTRYAMGLLHLLHGRYEEGLNELYQAALLDPGNEGLVQEVSTRLVHAQKGAQAAEVLTKAAEQPGASAPLFARLALVNLTLGKREAAQTAARAAIRRDPRLLAGYQYLAQIHFQSNRRDEALAVLAEAARQKDVDAAFLIELADTYLSHARAAADPQLKAEVLALLKRAESLPNTNPLLLHRLGDLYDTLGEPERATGVFARLLEQYPDLTEVRRRLADYYLRRAELTNAVPHLELILRANPTDHRLHFILGAVALEQRKPKEAIEHFHKALLLNPDYEPVYYDLAIAQISTDQPKAALDTLAKARDKFKATFQSEYYAGLAYSRLKDYSNAVHHLVGAEVIARATATNRLTHVFYFQLGAAYERNKQYAEAEQVFRKVLELAPDFAEALNYLGYMWAERGVNLAEAQQMIEKAVQMEPKNAAYLDSLGWVLFQQGKPAEALPWLLKAIEHIEEPDATLYDHLGDIYAALGQPEKAREAWQKALAIEPSDALRKKLGEAPLTGNPAR